jgi:hypothetical protein
MVGPRSLLLRLTAILVLAAAGAISFGGRSAASEVAPPVEETYPSLQIRGFSDVNYSFDSPGGFHLGQFVLHMASPLAKKTSFFGELSATPSADNFAFEVERAFIRYDYNDAFKISFGRYHTPIGYWNTAYHHGLWLQTTIRRPEYIRFGSTFVPVHFIGAVAEGRIPSGPIGLGYAAGIGNGRGDVPSRGGDAGDVNHNRAWIAQLTSRPIALLGFEAGAALYRDQLPPLELDTTSTKEWIGSVHVALTRETPELIAEYVRVRHESPGRETNDHSFYAQAAYRLPGGLHMAKPYGRYEELRVTPPPFATLLADGTEDVDIVTAGIRLDLIPLAAFKVEYRNERLLTGHRNETVLAQTCFTF